MVIRQILEMPRFPSLYFPQVANPHLNMEVLGSIRPGGSGIQMLSRNGPSLAVSYDEKFEGKYNIVSFDPRGVGDTWPRISCFQDQIEELYVDTVAINNGLPRQHSSLILQHEVGIIYRYSNNCSGSASLRSVSKKP